jgi:MFS family permease
MPVASAEPTRLRDLSPHQVKSGLAAWLGWLFDGLDMHLYTLVAATFVAQLLGTTTNDPAVGQHGALINAAFLVGWAFGGAFFGRVGDVLGRSRTLVLTYACFTGLAFFAQTWWQLLIFRFLAALGIGGEWAVGASLLSETWPKAWRPWIAATLQCAVNLGVLLACFADYMLKGTEPRYIFLVGILPALITLWIRKAVPETDEWEQAREGRVVPKISALFGPKVIGVTWRVLLICAVSLTAHWAFMFWQTAFISNHSEVVNLASPEKRGATLLALFWLMIGSLVGNFGGGLLAKLFGYRYAISIMLAGYFASMWGCFHTTWDLAACYNWFIAIGFFQGAFGLFTMCLPPLFPTLLRTTGSGFCYNFGRIVAAAGTIYFGYTAAGKIGDYAGALMSAGWLLVPAALLALLLPSEPAEQS